MKFRQGTILSGAVVLLMNCLPLPALAGVSVANTRSATLDFTNDSGITHTLTPVPGVPASAPANTVLANGAISSIDGGKYMYALRYTPNFPKQTSGGFREIARLLGQQNESNKLMIMMQSKYEMKTNAKLNIRYWTEAAASREYTVVKEGSDVTPIDTYITSIDALIYTP